MLRDDIVEEVRRVRHKIEEECEDDPQKYYEHIQEIQNKYRNRLVRFKPKPTLRKKQVAV